MDHHCSEYKAKRLLKTRCVTLLDVQCSGDCRHRTAPRSCPVTHLVFPYRGTFLRHVGATETVAEANQLVFLNEGEEYSVSHPAEGGDACLLMSVDPELICELSTSDQLLLAGQVRFQKPSRGIDSRAQSLLAILRYGFLGGFIEPLEAETLALTLVRRSLGERVMTAARSGSYGHQKLVNRVKLLLASDPGQRWTLASMAREIGGISPVYLTHIFAKVEGVPLYQYQLRLRLARALHLLNECSDLTTLALDMGFSSHSHFSAAFRQHYGRSPKSFQRAVRLR